MKSPPYFIYGKHAVLGAISNHNRCIVEILCTDEMAKIIDPYKVNYKITNNLNLKQLTQGAVHQGIVAKVHNVTKYNMPQEILDKKLSRIIVLDQITDPYNLGAILRSAAAFNIDAVVYPKYGSAIENGIVAKVASGALDIVSLVEVVNINNFLLDLKRNNFWVLGMDGNAKSTLSNVRNMFDSKLAIVMGSEGDGIRKLVAKNCDMLIKLEISSKMESLNVSNAAAIVMWELSKT